MRNCLFLSAWAVRGNGFVLKETDWNERICSKSLMVRCAQLCPMGGGPVGLWPDNTLRSSPPSLIHSHNPSPAYGSKEAVGNILLLNFVFSLLFSLLTLFKKWFLSFLWAFLSLFLRHALGTQCSFGSGTCLWGLTSMTSIPDMVALLYRPRLLRWKCLVQQMSQD